MEEKGIMCMEVFGKVVRRNPVTVYGYDRRIAYGYLTMTHRVIPVSECPLLDAQR